MSARFLSCRVSLRGVTAFPALMAAFVLLPSPAVRAQDLPPGAPPGGTPTNPADQTVTAAPEPGDRKLPLESVAPYSSWKHHVAEKPEQAVVQVRFAATANAPGGTATGLVVRCDGFVLVPRAVRDAARNGGRVEVVYPEADGASGAENEADQISQTRQSGKRSPVTVPARYHAGVNASVPYALVKTNGAHVRSLPLLESRNIAPGQPVRLMWSVAAGGALSEVKTQRGLIGPSAGSKETFSISLVAGTADAAPADAAPAGAFVIDEASGAAVGMVTQGGATLTFTTLARFRVIAGEIGVAPDRASVRLGDSPGALPKGSPEMVFVPGGPVALDGAAAKESSLAYGTTVACTPGFWMAVQPVTNGEYRTWLTGKGLPLPYGWNDNDLVVPVRRPDRPACGMFVEEAVSYAASHQSRLPTEVEWRRAAYTTDTAWVEEHNATWNRAADDIQRMFFDISYQLEAARRAAIDSVRARRPNIPNTPNAPNTRVNALVSSTPELDAAVRRLDDYITNFLGERSVWGQVGQIDAYRQDVSVFGVRNVLINAPEMVLSRLHRVTYAAKRYPAGSDPDLVLLQVSVDLQGTVFSREMRDAMERLVRMGLMIVAWRGGAANVAQVTYGGSGSSQGGASETLSLQMGGSVRPQSLPGFRCAR